MKGSIYRVSGPLVIADGMRGSKVYEVVEVGEERLIGEIIGVEGEKAIIQVYEDTTGLKVGDPVYGTGYPLAAELGPGLVGSIYDGIQRPLPVLEELVGFFVKRGVKAAPLPRDKRWHFIPLAKKGDKVGPGDYLGYVVETETVKHYIMVPPGVHGVLEEIVGEGDYTVEETIAVVDGRELNMIQKWPVRKPRPYREKLEPREPLITGQRVIDFFFPLAKGGKAAIPGGFGTGKCVLPGTPVLLSDWSIKTVDEIFREVKGGDPDPSVEEEVYTVDKPLYVYSFDGEKLRLARVTHVYRGFTDKIVRIKTSSGRVLEVTPAHKLPVYSPEGYVEFIEAYRLRPRMYLVIPRMIPSSGKLQLTPIEKLAVYDDVVSRDPVFNEYVREFMRRKLSRDQLETLSKETGFKLSTIKTIMYKRGSSIPLKLLVVLNKMFNDTIGYPRLYGLRRSRLVVRIPEVITEDLAELLGLVMSDGAVIRRRVEFFNNDPVLRSRFRELIKKVFGVDCREAVFNTVAGVVVYSSLIARFFRVLGVPDGRKSRRAVVPEAIIKSPRRVVAAFIRGLYLGDGCFSKSGIEYSSVSKKLVTGLAYLLTKLGILYSISLDKKDRYRLYITGKPEIEKFYRMVLVKAPSVRKVVCVREYISTKKYNRLSREAIPISPSLLKSIYHMLPKRRLESMGIYISGQLYGGENTSYYGLKKILSVVENTGVSSTVARLVSVARNTVTMMKYVALDMVEEVEVISRKTIVYDITVEDTHNFVGGLVPVIYHNTVTLQQLTKWSAVDIAIYVGCGERGNEMADALHSFRRLVDPRTGKPLVERSVFIANTSNMPVAARETSVFLGATIGEYFRDMGYHVLMVADSTSRWAEAMREISGRLEELPGEEGYPAYLGSRLASFYERSGYVKTLGRPDRRGSLTIMGAVSPPGADFSEPVTQATLRIVRALYALDVALAYRRHYPAINWLTSYSLYVDNVTEWWHNEIGGEWRSLREKALAILQKEAELEELVRLVGAEALPEEDKLVLEVARMIREDFLQQNAFHEIDTYCPPKKALLMMKAIIMFYELGLEAIRKGITVDELHGMKCRIKIARMKEIPNVGFEEVFKQLFDEIRGEFESKIREVGIIGSL